MCAQRHRCATVALRNLGHDGQTQPAATGHFTGPPEALEHVLQVGRAQPRPVVFHLQHTLALAAQRAQGDGGAAPGVADGVVEQVAQGFPQQQFVGGNHENYIDSARALELIARQGVKILHNEKVETNGIQLVGLDYMRADEQTFDMHPSADTRTIQSVLADLPVSAELPAVLMHHSPVGVRYVAAAGIDLMLAGHTHGGQLFPATIIAGLLFPFNQGLYVRGDTQVFVSQGAGTFLPRIRLGTGNEINFIRLLPSNPV